MKRTAINSKGFTVVEVLVAIGIMGIVSLGIAEMFRQMAEQQRNVVQLMNKQFHHLQQR
jgi:prepilin-type N-terminal cleavage/methylation domain-containing protein